MVHVSPSKRSTKELKHVDTVVNIIQPLPFPITNSISNTHNNQIPQVDIFATNLSTSSRADQDVVSYEIIYSYDLQHHVPWYQLVFKEVNGV